MTNHPRSRPHTLGSYADCWPILDAALAHNGVRFPCASAARAITIRHRLYRARKLLQQKAEEAAKPGQHATTPYDSLVIKLVPHTARGDEPAELHLEMKAPEEGLLEAMTDLDGNPITGDVADDLQEQAAQLKNKLGLE